MNTQTTLTCPNCGASITNTQNCEFCGSLLIRLQQQGIDIEQAGYKDDSKIFKGLTGALKRNLDLQKATNYKECILTEINDKDSSLFVGVTGCVFDEVEFVGKERLDVYFPFCPDKISGHELLLRKFRNLDIYELFTEDIHFDDDDNKKWYGYNIVFGSDAEGAARLISKVLHEVYSIPYEEILDYSTGIENNEEGTNQGGESNQGEEKSWPLWHYLVAAGIGLLIFLFQMC
jgi:hypothetical protein